MKARTVEEMLNDQIAACVAATEDCLAHSRAALDDGHLRRMDLDYVAKLVKANGHLAAALARLKGDTTHSIVVARGDAARGRVTHAGRKADKSGEGI